MVRTPCLCWAGAEGGYSARCWRGSDASADSPSPFSLLYSDLITLALPKRLNRFLTLSWYQPAVPIFTTLHTTLSISLESGQKQARRCSLALLADSRIWSPAQCCRSSISRSAGSGGPGSDLQLILPTFCLMFLYLLLSDPGRLSPHPHSSEDSGSAGPDGPGTQPRKSCAEDEEDVWEMLTWSCGSCHTPSRAPSCCSGCRPCRCTCDSPDTDVCC